jgi:(1->4)-alpha-D-glucan 1-alpha-D-glucosylmutase
MTTPGIPDVYQGTELFDFNLVDPDNRRPIDFKLRSQLLKEIRNKACTDLLGLLKELLCNRTDGRIKLFLIAVSLQARKENSALFQNGDYVPLMVEGSYGQHVIAFARSFENFRSITVAPRLLTQLIKTDELPLGNEIWQDTSVIFPDNAPFRWQNIFTKEVLHAEKTVRMGDILHKFPVALLMGEVTN